MSSQRPDTGVLIATVAVVACCLGLPLLAVLGTGALLWVLGVGVPVVVLVIAIGVLVGIRRHRTAAGDRDPTGRGDKSGAE